MKNRSSERPREAIDLNLTSMIDVVFLLLVFFVVTADFKAPEKTMATKLAANGAIVVDQPKTQEERDLGKIVVRIRVDAANQIEFHVDDKRAANLDELEAILDALREIDPNARVVVAPERNAPIESALDVYDSARRVGLAKISFAASPEALAR